MHPGSIPGEASNSFNDLLSLASEGKSPVSDSSARRGQRAKAGREGATHETDTRPKSSCSAKYGTFLGAVEFERIASIWAEVEAVGYVRIIPVNISDLLPEITDED